MEVLLNAEHQCLILWNALHFVTPLPRNLDSCLNGFRAGIHWQNHVEAKKLGGELREFREYIVIESPAAEG
jgi:hypothetical protein